MATTVDMNNANNVAVFAAPAARDASNSKCPFKLELSYSHDLYKKGSQIQLTKQLSEKLRKDLNISNNEDRVEIGAVVGHDGFTVAGYAGARVIIIGVPSSTNPKPSISISINNSTTTAADDDGPLALIGGSIVFPKKSENTEKRYPNAYIRLSADAKQQPKDNKQQPRVKKIDVYRCAGVPAAAGHHHINITICLQPKKVVTSLKRKAGETAAASSDDERAPITSEQAAAVAALQPAANPQSTAAPPPAPAMLLSPARSSDSKCTDNEEAHEAVLVVPPINPFMAEGGQDQAARAIMQAVLGDAMMSTNALVAAPNMAVGNSWSGGGGISSSAGGSGDDAGGSNGEAEVAAVLQAVNLLVGKVNRSILTNNAQGSQWKEMGDGMDSQLTEVQAQMEGERAALMRLQEGIRVHLGPAP